MQTRHASLYRWPLWFLYVFAVGVTVATLLVRLGLTESFGVSLSLIIFMVPISLSAYVAGLGPGLVSTLVAAVSADYFLIPPTYSFKIEKLSHLVQIVALIGVGAFVSVLTEFLHRSRWQLRLVHDQLEQRVEERTEELKETVAQLANEVSNRKLAEQELAKLNKELDQRIKERTAELEFANRELEAFSSSVAHDLKTPVHAIEGFSRILMRKYSATLESEPLRMLNIICSNTKRVSQMINDLLAFSRTSRKKVRKAEINLYAMTTRVFEQLRHQTPERDIKITLGELPPAIGDPSLIEQVMVNLLANAIKFTSSRKTTVIEVGGRTEGQETIYYVKDNGVGFNEQYAHNLYGVFQQLHTYDDYGGSGVGLSIVKRIIERHGGRVWAEGKVDQGATFYFTLPQNKD